MVSYKALNTMYERGSASSNRTFMELKYLRNNIGDSGADSSNRTFMELKYSRTNPTRT